MKIQTPAILHFEPRRLRSDDNTPEDKREQLFGENPTFARSVDVANFGHSAIDAWTHLKNSPVGHVAAGGIAVGAGIWGANKLMNGKTFLDRVEGVGLLAMAADRAIDASGGAHPGGSTAAGLVQCGADLVLGAADIVRGAREDNKRRLTVGLCQSAVGACIGASALFPSIAGVSTAVMCVAAVTKQVAIGFHFGLPD